MHPSPSTPHAPSWGAKRGEAPRAQSSPWWVPSSCKWRVSGKISPSSRDWEKPVGGKSGSRTWLPSSTSNSTSLADPHAPRRELATERVGACRSVSKRVATSPHPKAARSGCCLPLSLNLRGEAEGGPGSFLHMLFVLSPFRGTHGRPGPELGPDSDASLVCSDPATREGAQAAEGKV